MKTFATVVYPLLVTILKSLAPHLYDALIAELAANKLLGVDIAPAVAAELSKLLADLKPSIFPTA
jgi:hypothetical protein